MIRNLKRKNKRKIEKAEALEQIHNKRKENWNISGLYSSFEDEKVFDSQMVKSIYNDPICTEVNSDYSQYNIAMMSRM